MHIKEVGIWDDGLAQIGEMHFGIRIPCHDNSLFEIMGSMMGLGGSPRPSEPKIRMAESAPPAGVDLD